MLDGDCRQGLPLIGLVSSNGWCQNVSEIKVVPDICGSHTDLAKPSSLTYWKHEEETAGLPVSARAAAVAKEMGVY